MELSNPKSINIKHRAVIQQAYATIKDPIHAIIELVTNSDDSYKRTKAPKDEIIEIFVKRKRKIDGALGEIEISDRAEGISFPRLPKIFEYGGETSGYGSSRSIRGFFGRGLKEACVALGSGEILTSKDARISYAILKVDDGQIRYQSSKRDYPISSPEIKGLEGKFYLHIPSPNGTIIKISCTNEDMKIFDWEKFINQLCQHYALREIIQRQHVELHYQDDGQKVHKLHLEFPSKNIRGQLKYKGKEVELSKSGAIAYVTIYEAEHMLDRPPHTEHSLAGFTVKTNDIPIDHYIFGYDYDPCAYYFYGTIECGWIADQLRKGKAQGLLSTTREGLNWRSEFGRELKVKVREILEPLIKEKRSAIEKAYKRPPEKMSKALGEICDYINSLSKEFIEGIEDKIGSTLVGKIISLQVVPSNVNVEVGKSRELTIYLPKNLVKENHVPAPTCNLECDSDCIQLSAQSLLLRLHPKEKELFCNHFSVKGLRFGESIVRAKYLHKEDTCRVTVGPFGKRGASGKKLYGRKGGIFSEIKLDNTKPVIDRVAYANGTIFIYTNFPATSIYFDETGNGLDTPQAQTFFAELLGEAVSRTLARLISEKRPPLASEVDAYQSYINEVRSKILDKLHLNVNDILSKYLV